MSNSEYNNHKNFELFRFYLSRDISKLDKKIEKQNNEIIGYVLASLVDVMIVMIFQEYLSKQEIIVRICSVFILLVLFILISWSTKIIVSFVQIRSRESGIEEYVDREKRQERIDEFDNIACDGLLICENYIEKYKQTSIDYLREFFLYEVVHHMTKAVSVFDDVYNNRDNYISSKKSELIDVYRANNFMDFSKAVMLFLNEEAANISDKDLNADLINLNSSVDKWKRISE